MRASSIISLFCVLITAACVDRLSYNVGTAVNFGISIDGYISNDPGPYEILIYSIFDIESKETTKTPVSVRSVVISDDKGNSEVLNEISEGIYQTDPAGIRGTIGGIYQLKVELFDGRIYESLPDTISAPGSLDSLYLKFSSSYTVTGQQEYAFDVLFDASYDERLNEHFLWSFTGTFQSETHPELYPVPSGPGTFSRGECFWLPELGHCNYLPPCSGYRNVGSDLNPEYKKKYDCTCCTCWYNLFNASPILSDELVGGKVIGARAGAVPLNGWTLEHKIRVDVSQMSLTRNTYRFWKAVRDQKRAAGNLFQPVSGKIPSNFNQIAGASIPIEGLFFATSISRQVKYVDRFHLPVNLIWTVPTDTPSFNDDCRKLFANSTNRKPVLWKD